MKQDRKKTHWKDWLGQGHFVKRLMVAVFFFIALTLFVHFREVRVEVIEQGTIAERYIIGQVDFSFPDEEATRIIKQQSVRDIGPIYQINESELSEVRSSFEKELIRGDDWRGELRDVTFDDLYRGATALENTLAKARFVDRRTFQKIIGYELSTENYYLYVPESMDQPKVLPSSLWAELEKHGLLYGNYPKKAAEFISNAFKNRSWTLTQDFAAERSLRLKVSEGVPEQYTQVRAGERIVDQGEKITSRHLSMLQAMKEALADQRNLFSIKTIFASVILSLLFTVLSIIYFRINHTQILDSLQKMTLMVMIVVLTLLFSKIAEYLLVNKTTHLIDIFRYPIIVPFASILIYVLVGSEVALFGSAFLSIVIGVTLAIDHDRFLIINLTASWVTVLFARNMHKRKEVFSVLAKVWLTCVPVILAFNLAQDVFTLPHLFEDIASSLIFITAIALLVIGLLPLLESIFHVMTDMTLMEYMDPNNELLRRLSVEAPGTYQHSLVIGNLAESAARAIGANGLFCRVATLYHDIGKLFNPHYFTENQLGGFNIHQLLTPLESTQVIIAHVPEGEALARKHKLPQGFIDIIREHHGDTLVYFFYHKQLEHMGGDEEKVEEKLFRYSGPRPRSKESAIIMLADTVEAASRSLDQTSEEALAEMVDRLIKAKTDDHQLDECQLTFEELGIVKKTLVKTLTIAGHLRVKYPQQKAD